MEQVKELLVSILKGITSQPDAIVISEKLETDDNGEAIIISVTPHSDDIGTCIGVKGATAQAIRKVIGLYALKTINKRVFVKIEAPDKQQLSRFDYNN